MTNATTRPFTRTPFTLAAYVLLAYFAYLMAILGPAIPYLRDELQLTYTEAGNHFTGFAAGMVLMGLFGERFIRRWGRRAAFWFGGGGMAASAYLFLSGQSSAMTVGAAFLMGLIGSLLLLTIQAGLADLHGAQRGVALTESNVAASVFAGLAPLFIGEFERSGIGWRAAILVAIAVWVVTAIRFHALPIPERQVAANGTSRQPSNLPEGFWLVFAVVVLCVAAEWSLGYWGATFLQDIARFNATDASTAMTVFFGAIVLGRLAGSQLARRYDPRQLLFAAMLVSLIGFPLFWLGTTPTLTLIGLFVVGFGVANQFPLALTVMMSLDPSQSAVLSARTSLASGVAVLTAPQILGVIADQSSLFHAYGVVAVLLLAATAGVAYAARTHRPRSAHPLG